MHMSSFYLQKIEAFLANSGKLQFQPVSTTWVKILISMTNTMFIRLATYQFGLKRKYLSRESTLARAANKFGFVSLTHCCP